MLKKGFFITGTDTGAGKTWATIALMRYFKLQGNIVVGMKPVATGCNWHNGQLKNSDALLVQENSSIQLDYQEINPYAFETPVSPHLAAKNNPVKVEVILQAFNNLKDKADIVLVEGVGGWLAPLSHEYDVSDLVKALQLPVIMVVAIRLGCINHARLTFQAIQEAKIKCAGWIAMCIDPDMTMRQQNIDTIKNKIATPLFGTLPYSEEKDFDALVARINLFNTS